MLVLNILNGGKRSLDIPDNELVFEDAETQGGYQKEITFELIVYNHLNKILSLASVEWKGGYTTVDKRGNEMYVPDTRAQYWNAVNALSDICLPHFDEEMTKAENKHISEEKKLFEDWYRKNQQGIPIPRFGEQYEEKFKDGKLILKRSLFRELSKFLKRKNYFKPGEIIDRV